MKGFQIKKHAHPSQISVSTDLSVPTVQNPTDASNRNILVDVYTAGLNFFDILQAQGKYQNQPPLPFILGTEMSGRISSSSPIPAGCPFKRGQRIFGAAQGAFGEHVVADWKMCLPVPDELSWEQAAGLYVTYPTSYEGLVGRACAKAGEWVLVHAGAGGVGLAAVQIAKALGCKVIATASSESKREICVTKGGADFVIDYGREGWQKEVIKITGGKGVDVVYDPVGLIIPTLKCVRWKARIIVVGFAAGTIEKIPANLILLKNIAILGVHWGAYTKNEPERTLQVWKELLDMIKKGILVPAVYDKVYQGLESIPEGLKDLEMRKTWGKAVVRVRDDDETPNKKVKAKL